MVKMNIWSYKDSDGAKELAKELGILRLKREGSKYIPGKGKIIINWGDSAMPKHLLQSKVINNPHNIALVTNKLKFFDLMKDTDVRIPEFTTDKNVAIMWIAEGHVVVERHKLQGHSGEGIRIVEKGVDIQKAPLYTKYVPKKDEFRVHFVGDKIIYVQQKKRKVDVPDENVNWKVRNNANGFIYAREGVEIPPDVTEQAMRTIKACGLDFGAIDILYTKKTQQATVLEVNTAPGLEGQSIKDYAKALSAFAQQGV